MDEASIERLVQRTRVGGMEIVQLLKTGSAYYAPGASAAKMVEAVVKDEKRLVAASAYLRGEYGHSDIFLGVPVLLGRNGVERIVKLDLSAAEQAQLDASAASVRKGVETLESFYKVG